ncbi:thiamine diphosphokinase [Primorskyibacter sp. 2E233]|uniref:thiamine diphosphokinase n=1 Tax=Primorskyibacter sp. 2E233 TaxID=3413431 RepID=UPI003BF22589
MKSKIVHAFGPVLLVGGGECTHDVLKAAVSKASAVVAADGGAAPLLAIGVVPEAVIGDMDSLDPALQASLPPGVLRRIAEQDSTDFDKCLRNISAPLVLAYGFLGARVDHQLAALTVLCNRADRRCVVVGTEDVIVLAPPELTLDLPKGTRFSLYPMGKVQGRSEGLRWPIDGLVMSPDTRVGTSNEVVGPVRLSVEAPRMLLILPAACLEALLEGLAAAPGGWPVRA